jgi:hypothetical protein
MRPFKISCLRAITETRVFYAHNRDEALKLVEEETSSGAVIDVYENKAITEEEARLLLVGSTVAVIHSTDSSGKTSVQVFEDMSGALNTAVGTLLNWMEENPDKLETKDLVEINVHVDAWRLVEAIAAFNKAHESINSLMRISILETPILKKIA